MSKNLVDTLIEAQTGQSTEEYLRAVGPKLSAREIARIIRCSHPSISKRLRALGIAPKGGTA